MMQSNGEAFIHSYGNIFYIRHILKRCLRMLYIPSLPYVSNIETEFGIRISNLLISNLSNLETIRHHFPVQSFENFECFCKGYRLSSGYITIIIIGPLYFIKMTWWIKSNERIFRWPSKTWFVLGSKETLRSWRL